MSDSPQLDPTTRPPEPVAISQAVGVLLATLVAAGWFTIDSVWINVVLTAVGAAATIAATLKARSAVDAHR
ncbi:MAG: hypothetical protein H7Y15_05370 [Pseudonocardia sp.]|nr:hypothetical protein [Pseudonocardia sp.]